MYIHADMRGVRTLLLALDGVPVGLVVEADTAEGWVRRYDTRDLDEDPRWKSAATGDEDPDWKRKAEERGRRVAAGPIVRIEGKVDFVGDTATDPAWMIEQRLTAIRIRHGLPIDTTVAHDTSSMAASVLERLASQLRSGSMVASSLGMTRAAEHFPLPEDKVKYVQTGAVQLVVDYASVDGVRAYEDAKAVWVKENPDLVAEHVRSLTETVAASVLSARR